ncbi:MAG: LysM peptidoglycan-binding domain-containing protein [Nevskia sp.]
MLMSLAAGCASQGSKTSSSAPESLQTAPAPAPASTIQPVNDNATASAAAGSLSLRADAPLRYKVKKGDTLWDISKYFLRDAWQWPELWYTNSQVKNPHLIYPGETLTLVIVNGKTRLARESALNLERLSPRIREEALDAALPAIPIEAIRNFLRGPRVVTLEEAAKAPYVLAFLDEHIAASANTDIYVKNAPVADNLSYAIVQIGEPYRDPDTRELLGYEALPAGEAELRVPGPTATMRVTKSTREILVADRLLPIEAESFEANFYPHPPANPIDARIISVFDGLGQISQYQIVALNRGSNHGLDPGTVLDIYQSGRLAPDPYGAHPVLLPDLYAGVMMVFKVTPKVSYALIMNATRAVHVLDKGKKPVPGSH